MPQWGVSPTHPRIVEKQELLEVSFYGNHIKAVQRYLMIYAPFAFLQRFYFIHNPENVTRTSQILKHWKGEVTWVLCVSLDVVYLVPEYLFHAGKVVTFNCGRPLEKNMVETQAIYFP